MIFLDCDTPRFILRLYSLGFTPVFPYTAKKALLISLFRHRNHFFLFSRPYRTVLIDKLFSSQVFLFLFSVQKHQFYKVHLPRNLVTSSRKSCFCGTRICSNKASVPNSLPPGPQDRLVLTILPLFQGRYFPENSLLYLISSSERANHAIITAT